MFTATEAVPVAKVVAGNKRYPGVVALDNVNFTLNKGEVRALLGKNGAGKSTLIRMLTGSERPDSGDIWIGETRLEGDEATLTRRAAELGSCGLSGVKSGGGTDCGGKPLPRSVAPPQRHD
ncbi:ATP-binding cassette domain-containing protein [Escherichia coli]|nr:ATP-binding cassette domain-containing protein [Escherichia coli]